MSGAGEECGSSLLHLLSHSSSALVWILHGLQSLWEYLLCHGAPTSPLTLVFALLFITLFPLLLCPCGVFCSFSNVFSQRYHQFG